MSLRMKSNLAPNNEPAIHQDHITHYKPYMSSS